MMMPTNHERHVARMIRFVMIIAMIVTGMMVEHHTAVAQPSTPCDPCSLVAITPWGSIPEQSVTVTLGSGCSFTVYYKIRHCIDTYEVKIDRIVNANPPECDWMTQEEVASLAIGNMLKNNLIGAPALPQPGEHGAKRLRIIKPRCWRRITAIPACTGDGSYASGTIVGCSSMDCCSNMMWVERDWCDALTFVKIDASAYPILNNVYPSTANSPMDVAYNDWVSQFEPTTCEVCAEPLRLEGACISGCHEDMMARHNYLMQRFLQKLYKP